MATSGPPADVAVLRDSGARGGRAFKRRRTFRGGAPVDPEQVEVVRGADLRFAARGAVAGPIERGVQRRRISGPPRSIYWPDQEKSVAEAPLLYGRSSFGP